MPRIRTLKPEVLEDEKTAGLDDSEFRLFVACIVLADDYGNLRGSDDWLWGQVFWRSRRSREDVAKARETLETVGLLEPYSVHGQRYVHVSGWEKHQRVDHPGKPRVPLQSSADGEILARDSRESRESLATDPDLRPRPPTPTSDLNPLSGRPDGKGSDRVSSEPSGRKRRPAAASADVQAVWTYWQRVMEHPKAVLDTKRAGLIAARLAQGKTVADLQAAIRGCRRSPYHRGDNEYGTVYDGIELICRDAAHVEGMVARLEAAKLSVTEHRWQERDGRWWANATHKAREGTLLDMGPRSAAEWDAAPVAAHVPAEPTADAGRTA